jgi:hypothetical protein
MKGPARGSGQRSGLYSQQRYTNWTAHDPHWSEITALPPVLRPTAQVPMPDADVLDIVERPLADQFHRPYTVADVVNVLTTIPASHLSGLDGVYLMGGTAKQRRTRNLTFGMYSQNRIYLFPVATQRLADGWTCPNNPAQVQIYVRCGAHVRTSKRGATVTFDEESLRRFYLIDVLPHEIGHHVDHARGSTSRDAERFAEWFADYQYTALGRPGTK